MRSAEEFSSITSLLDARFHLMLDGVERSRETSLLELARILEEGRVPYALIGGVAVQFTDDPALSEAIATAERHVLGTGTLRISTARELVRAKLRAASDPGRRRSKRLQDLADACGLTEDHPEVLATLTDLERQRLDARL